MWKKTCAGLQTRQDAGEVTMLYNNAGIAGPMGKSWAIDAKHYLKTLDVNLNSHLFMIQEFLPSMLRNNKGHIIATCSILSFLTGAHGTSYVVSKHAVRALYECIKADIRKAGAESDIMITSVYPGFAATDLVAQFDFHSRSVHDVAGMKRGVLQSSDDELLVNCVKTGLYNLQKLPILNQHPHSPGYG